MKPNLIEQIDLKRRPIIAINKKIKKSENFVIPEIKVEAVNEAIKNTNLLEILNTHVKDNQ
jgi:hypothetical protein